MRMDGDRGETDTTEERVIFTQRVFIRKVWSVLVWESWKWFLIEETLKTEMKEFIKFHTELIFCKESLEVPMKFTGCHFHFSNHHENHKPPYLSLQPQLQCRHSMIVISRAVSFTFPISNSRMRCSLVQVMFLLSTQLGPFWTLTYSSNQLCACL